MERIVPQNLLVRVFPAIAPICATEVITKSFGNCVFEKKQKSKKGIMRNFDVHRNFLISEFLASMEQFVVSKTLASEFEQIGESRINSKHSLSYERRIVIIITRSLVLV